MTCESRDCMAEARRQPVTTSTTARKASESEPSRTSGLRQRAGNHGVQRLLGERGDLGAASEAAQSGFKSDDGHDLKSERFSGDARLENIFDGRQEQFLRSGASGEAVAKVQQTLIELGIPLPKSGADGLFGGETGSAVSKFKTQHGIAPADAVVGSRTIAALDAELLKHPPVAGCVDGPVNMEAEPLPPITFPSVTRMSADEVFAAARRTQVKGGHVPRFPPLGANAPRMENGFPVTLRTELAPSGDCLKCIADWEPPRPQMDIFTAAGDFSDEPKRSFPVQEQSVSGCPFETGGTFKEVNKRILPEAEPSILEGELEHWSDLMLTHLLITGRYLSNVRRLTPARTHLRGKDAAECAMKVEQFLSATSNPGFPAVPVFGQMCSDAVRDVYFPTTAKREDDHSATPVPPMGKKPVFPNIDPQVNPFVCKAFFRKFDRTIGLKRGAPFDTLLEDKQGEIPPKQPWNTL